MGLKEEIKKIEEEEREQEEEDKKRLREWEVDDAIKGLYARVNVIIEYLEERLEGKGEKREEREEIGKKA